MKPTAGVVASLRGTDRGQDRHRDVQRESGGRVRGAKGPSITGVALTGSAPGSERPDADERMMSRGTDRLRNKVTLFLRADNRARGPRSVFRLA